MSSSPLILTADHHLDTSRAAREFGGKAANLATLSATGQPVPPWFAISADAYRMALAENAAVQTEVARLTAQLRGPTDRAAIGRVTAALRQCVLGLEVAPALATPITDAYRHLFPGDVPVAVRSSAPGEDDAACSFAGMHDTILNTHGTTALTAAIHTVWASGYSERAIAYRLQHGLALDGIALGVVVQALVEPEVSGVMFTANPATGNVLELTISSLFGFGEGLVTGGLDADTFVVEKKSLRVRATVVGKPLKLTADRQRGCGLRREAVPEPLRQQASLNEAQLRVLAGHGVAIERLYGRPQDIEFCLDLHGRVHILQARPITTVREYGPAAGNPLVWDNANITESYSGVTSPLTFSFIRKAYTIVYHCFAEVMGVRPEAVRRNRPVFENMLGLFRGQVYYNLLNWYRLIRLFPGFAYNKPFMESMMGLKEPQELHDETGPVSAWQRYCIELPALLRLILRSTRNFCRIRRLVQEFQGNFNRHYDRWAAMDLRRLAPHELLQLYRQMEDAFLWEWKAPIVNDFFVMIFHGTLRKLCVSWCGDRTGSLANELICGEGGIESTEPTRRLLRLAATVQADAALRALILDKPAAELAASVPADPRFRDFSDQLREYLDRYGFRCMNELKLEEHSLRERPHFVYTVIRNYVAMNRPDVLDVGAIEEREHGLRRQAEARAFLALRAAGGVLPRRWILTRILRCARLGVRNRENLRFARAKIYGLVRDLFRAMAEHLHRDGVLRDPEDIFYLTVDEIWDYVKGTAVTTDLQALADLRRAEFAGYRSGALPSPADHFETYGMPYQRNLFRNYTEPSPAAAAGELRGTGCCPGQVTGPVRVLRTPSDELRLAGEILATERTDPGWVPLFPSVSGLLIERGSTLSHTAIVAREMGIPTIVGIPRLTATLRSGQVVAMDGANGTVHIEVAAP